MNEAVTSCNFSSYALYSLNSASNGGRVCSRQQLFTAKTQATAGESCSLYRTFIASTTERNSFSKINFRIQRLPHNIRRSSIRALRREPISQAQRNAELEEEAKKIDLAPHKLLEKGEPGTMQGIIKDVIPVGYFLTLPNGRDGYLPALDLGFTGGIVILERLFKVGQELTVRVVRLGGGGREILSIKKPEFAPNTDPKFIFSERGGFGKSGSATRVRQ